MADEKDKHKIQSSPTIMKQNENENDQEMGSVGTLEIGADCEELQNYHCRSGSWRIGRWNCVKQERT